MPSGQPNTSIIVGNCIACQGLVRVPSTINAQSNVRCPHCQETFALSVLLDQSVPELEVVDAQSNSESTKPSLYIDQQAGKLKDEGGKFVVPSQLAKGARRRGKSRRSRSKSSRNRDSRGGGENKDHSRPKQRTVDGRDSRASPRNASENRNRDQVRLNEGESVGRPSTSRRPTVSPAQRNPVVEFLKVMCGAALAIPIAYLVVLWVFGQDPLGFGRPMGRIAPFMVPESYRGDQPKPLDADAPEAYSDSNLDQLPNNDFDKDLLNIGKEALDGLSD